MQASHVLLIYFLLIFDKISTQNVEPKCEFVGQVPNYRCDFRIFNPNGRDNFVKIIGEHLSDLFDSDVTILVGNEQHSLVIPSIICNAFKNLYDFTFTSSEISILSSNAFTNCTNLRNLILFSNKITQLPENLFKSNANLRFLNLEKNSLTQINSNSFGSALTSLESFFVTFNDIFAINEDFFTFATKLRTFWTDGNRCVSQNFFIWTSNRENVRAQLWECFKNFENAVTTTILPPQFENTIECIFNFPQFLYNCQLFISNPFGHDDFNTINGVHLNNHDDNSVESLTANYQTTKNFPSIICRKFTNILTIEVIASQLSHLSRKSFDGCTRLVSLSLANNKINILPSNIFARNQFLATLDIASNELDRIESEAFVGTQITQLKLSNNRLRVLESATFRGLASSMEFLYLNDNPLENMSVDIFSELSNVLMIDMSNCRLRELKYEMFSSLSSLIVIILDSNNLSSLDSRYFTNENHTTLDKLHIISARNNEINAIDENIINMASKLSVFYLTGNVCVDNDFWNIENNRDNVRNQLQSCFNNFKNQPINESYIKCNYVHLNYFICDLQIENINGRNDFETIEGTLLMNTSYDDISEVSAFLQNTSNIPSIICRQFPKLIYLWMEFSAVRDISLIAFESCSYLRTLVLAFNEISFIPDGTFRNLRNLTILSLRLNEIEMISAQTFDGLSENLESLLLPGNLLSSIPFETFDAFKKLAIIDISFNRISVIDSRSFGFSNIVLFIVDSNQINSIDEIWFDNTGNLEVFSTTNNICVDSIFQNVQNNRVSVRNELQKCFDNFDSKFIRCEYQLTPHFTCDVKIFNPNGSEFEFIEGYLPVDRDYNEVYEASAYFQNTSNIPSIICRQFPQLRDLFVIKSGLTHISQLAFAHCNNLDRLALTYNTIATVPDDTFLNLNHLKAINLSYNRLNVIYGEIFKGLDALERMYLEGNEIYEIPNSTFDNLLNLELLNVKVNKISRLDFEAFGGASLRNLHRFLADDNSINIVDQLWFDSASNLRILHLRNNTCISNQFDNVQDNRVSVRNELQSCFNVDESFIECFYSGTSCFMSIYNPNGSEFEFIEGNLPNNLTYDDVIAALVFFQHTTNIPSIICRQFPNLIEITVIFSQLRNVTWNAFENCDSLEILSLAQNEITFIADETFINLNNLRVLNLFVNSIERITSRMFAGLHNSLTSIELSMNNIRSIEFGAFNELARLESLYIWSNQFFTLDSRSFGNSLSSLREIFADFCSIDAIDEEFFDSAVNLIELSLRDNLCVNRFFANVQDNRQSVRNELNNCFNNFSPDIFIRCEYDFSPNFLCWLQILNPTGRNNFETVEGLLPNGTSYNDVTEVIMSAQNSLNFPSIICETFENLIWISAFWSQIEIIDENSFRNCRNLLSLFLDLNNIARIPANVFANNQNLYFINLRHNQISEISVDAFVGLENSLQSLWIDYNNLRQIPTGLFSNLTQLSSIEINDNQLSTLDSRSFGSTLSSLSSFWAENNQINAIDSEFFDYSLQLTNLALTNNYCANNTFFNIEFNRDIIRNELQYCFHNFENQVNDFIRCDYIFFTGLRHCQLDIHNMNGRDDFRFIDGNLPSNFTYNDITTLGAIDQQTTNIPSIICQQFANLEDIGILNSQIATLSPSSFSHCLQLQRLYLAQNKITKIPNYTFLNNHNLTVVSFYDNLIDELSENSLLGLSHNLIDLSLQHNQLRSLPIGIFENLMNLQHLDLGGNHLRRLSVEHFGNSIRNLEFLLADNNSINAINHNVFDAATNLKFLHLSNNLCVSENFNSVQENRFDVRAKLMDCFKNYNEPDDDDGRFIKCNYFESDELRGCEIEIFNPNGRDDFEVIETNFPQNITNDQINYVAIFAQQTTVIPSVICNQFPNIITLGIMSNGINEISAEAINDCKKLESFGMSDENLMEIPENLFINHDSLTLITITFIYIEKIPSRLFEATPNITHLDLSHNLLKELPNGLISHLTRLIYFAFDGNQITTLNTADFGSTLLSNLKYFYARRNQINAIDRTWFESTHNLYTLFLTDNICVNEDFSNVLNNRTIVANQLTQCFENFDNQEVTTTTMSPPPNDDYFIRCEYFLFANVYCMMRIFNPNGRNDFDMIEGTLPLGRNYSEVSEVNIRFENTSIVPSVICQQFDNLNILSIQFSGLHAINEESFENCHHLTRLSLDFNNIAHIPDDSFRSLNHLDFLDLGFNFINSVTPNTFNGLINVREIHFDFNSISTLPIGGFARMRRLNTFDIAFNQLSAIDALSFDSETLSAIISFRADSNLINSIDINWFDSAVNLDQLWFASNLCVDRNFHEIEINRISVRNELSECFENFNGDSTSTTTETTTILPPDGTVINCLYGLDLFLPNYTCILFVNNPTGFEFSSISGNHMESFSNDDVSSVSALAQLTINVPSIICHQFKNLHQLWIIFSQVNVLTRSSFENCDNLWELQLSMNDISYISSGILPTTLRSINFEINSIFDIDMFAFNGLQLNSINLNNNNLRNLRLQWFITSVNSLTDIHLASNHLISIPVDAFVNLTTLTLLDVSNNALQTINSRSFQNSLITLRRFIATNNLINSIDPGFFNRAHNMIQLNLNDNLCVNQNFDSIINDRENVRIQLQICFDRFTNEF